MFFGVVVCAGCLNPELDEEKLALVADSLIVSYGRKYSEAKFLVLAIRRGQI